MKAVFISGLEYESPIQIGDHQLARQFAKNGWEIAFLSLPVTPFHIFGKNKNAAIRRMKSFIKGGDHYKIGAGTLWSFVPMSLIIPKTSKLLKNMHVYENWQKSLFPGFFRLLKKRGFDDVDLLYVRDPIQGFYLQKIKNNFSFYRVADNDPDFFCNNENYINLEERVAKAVDVVLYTAKNLETKIATYLPKKSYFLPNGVDNSFFQTANKEKPKEYEFISKPIIVYVGTLDYWFDYDLVNQLIAHSPEYEFFIIGPNEKFGEKFVVQKNLHLLGQIPYEEIPRYLVNAQVGIIPFNMKEFPSLVENINPIKLYEYMACELPVVATKWKTITELNSPAYLCSDFAEFSAAIKQAIGSKVKKNEGKQYALQNDWTNRFMELLELMNNKNNFPSS